MITFDGRVLHWEMYPDYNQLIMDIFSTHILTEIKKIWTDKRRPDFQEGC